MRCSIVILLLLMYRDLDYVNNCYKDVNISKTRYSFITIPITKNKAENTRAGSRVFETDRTRFSNIFSVKKSTKGKLRTKIVNSMREF